MNKKGFTLVELLAVIAILAILVIIALPNIMSMFNTAKKNVFLNEVKIVYTTAGKSYIKDKLANEKSYIYAKSEDDITCARELDLTSKRIYYFVKMNKSGKIQSIFVKDNAFQYQLESDDLDINDIKIEDVEELDGETEEIHITCSVLGTTEPEPEEPDEPVIPDGTPYTVTYNANGGTGTMTSSTAKYNENFVTKQNTFTRSGYTFDGWSVDSTNGTIWNLTSPGVYENGNGANPIKWTYTKDIILYAQWKSNAASYNFTFAYNGEFKVVDGTTESSYPANSSGTTTVTVYNNNWQLYLLTSGDLTINNYSATIDVFAVGGGGGGSGTKSSWEGTGVGGAGGAGGYVDNKYNIQVPSGINTYAATIGAGGANGTGGKDGKVGGTTSITIGSVTVSAAGGGGGIHTGTEQTLGTGKGGALAERGGDGVCPFTDCSYINYKYGAGGGGGGRINCGTINGGWCTRTKSAAGGGTDGGGKGVNGQSGKAGVANSGGGGGAGSPGERANDGNRPRKGGQGGSGIIIIRNHIN